MNLVLAAVFAESMIYCGEEWHRRALPPLHSADEHVCSTSSDCIHRTLSIRYIKSSILCWINSDHCSFCTFLFYCRSSNAAFMEPFVPGKTEHRQCTCAIACCLFCPLLGSAAARCEQWTWCCAERPVQRRLQHNVGLTRRNSSQNK